MSVNSSKSAPQERELAQLLLRFYKRWLSPLLPARCRFVPTCSEYAAEACARYGFFHGSLIAFGRLLRCHPFAHGGHDPVPVSNGNLRKHIRGVHTYQHLGAGRQ